MTGPGTASEPVEPDFDSTAEAWLSLQMTMLFMRFNTEAIQIALEYERRRDAERAGETP